MFRESIIQTATPVANTSIAGALYYINLVTGLKIKHAVFSILTRAAVINN